MCTGAHPAYMLTQVDRVFKEIGEHFDLASAMAVDGFAAVFGTVLERRAEGSRKRARSDAIQASESPVTGLGVPSQDSGPREDAEKADVPSKSARAPPLPSRSTDPSQAEEEEVEQQVQPHLKKARTAKGKEALRDKQPVATAAQKSRSRRGQIPPQMSEDGTEASERDVDKVVSTLV